MTDSQIALAFTVGMGSLGFLAYLAFLFWIGTKK